ncbi:hypothetical protein PPERSA_09707 [Pseudocohnilembus persalinus]|uniref:Uncharacterized protein n=1 Tax=Pseudocohnilembus persalinus TaxID=266149 RepID=A0A0V0QUV6_PSEPJ|nr:hypothetical protein PPERSA_09707 [Pseudocohnilembus persalinus]|eukprot:KRX06095.1 hypothetical protein PPERSA_09707 [Pseudocohnilembus persalinus]
MSDFQFDNNFVNDTSNINSFDLNCQTDDQRKIYFEDMDNNGENQNDSILDDISLSLFFKQDGGSQQNYQNDNDYDIQSAYLVSTNQENSQSFNKNIQQQYTNSQFLKNYQIQNPNTLWNYDDGFQQNLYKKTTDIQNQISNLTQNAYGFNEEQIEFEQQLQKNKNKKQLNETNTTDQSTRISLLQYESTQKKDENLQYKQQNIQNQKNYNQNQNQQNFDSQIFLQNQQFQNHNNDDDENNNYLSKNQTLQKTQLNQSQDVDLQQQDFSKQFVSKQNNKQKQCNKFYNKNKQSNEQNQEKDPLDLVDKVNTKNLCRNLFQFFRKFQQKKKQKQFEKYLKLVNNGRLTEKDLNKFKIYFFEIYYDLNNKNQEKKIKNNSEIDEKQEKKVSSTTQINLQSIENIFNGNQIEKEKKYFVKKLQITEEKLREFHSILLDLTFKLIFDLIIDNQNLKNFYIKDEQLQNLSQEKINKINKKIEQNGIPINYSYITEGGKAFFQNSIYLLQCMFKPEQISQGFINQGDEKKIKI